MACSRSPSASPSRVKTSCPPARTASRKQELTGRPSSNTVQVPHAPTPQLSRTLQSLKRSRRTSSRVSASSILIFSSRLLIRNVISRFIKSSQRYLKFLVWIWLAESEKDASRQNASTPSDGPRPIIPSECEGYKKDFSLRSKSQG